MNPWLDLAGQLDALARRPLQPRRFALRRLAALLRERSTGGRP